MSDISLMTYNCYEIFINQSLLYPQLIALISLIAFIEKQNKSENQTSLMSNNLFLFITVMLELYTEKTFKARFPSNKVYY